MQKLYARKIRFWRHVESGIEIAILILVAGSLIYFLFASDKPHFDIDPCEQANRGRQVTANGEFAGCTGDASYYRG